MKQLSQKFLDLSRRVRMGIATLSFVLVSLLLPSVALAAGGSISLTTARSTVSVGSTVLVNVYMNGGGNNVNGIEADLTYPADKLQYVGVSYTGSVFEITAPSGGGAGSVNIARGTTGAITGSGLVGTITFKALASSGSGSVSVAGSSALASDGNAVPTSLGGVGLTFSGVAAVAPITAKSPAVAATPAAPAAPAPPKDTTPPVITAIALTDVTPFSASVTWTTDEPSDSAVDFGLDADYGLSTSASTLTTKHVIVLNNAFLTPKTLLHYRVKSSDASGNIRTSTDQRLQLPGVPVTIIVRGDTGKPQAGATVSVDSSSGITDTHGSVTLNSGLGTKQVTTTYEGVTIRRPISVTKTTKTLPPYQLDLSKQPLDHWMLTSAGLLTIVFVLIAIDAFLFGSRILHRVLGLHLLQHRLHEVPGGSNQTAANVAAASVAVTASNNEPIPAAPMQPVMPDPAESPATDLDLPSFPESDDPVVPVEHPTLATAPLTPKHAVKRAVHKKQIGG